MDKKIIILVGDGMADYPIESLGGKTPLEYADIPNMDSLAKKGISGLVRTVPEGMDPGSDTANLSIFGYDPKKYYTGRAPLEAINMGIELGENDAAFRCNIVKIEHGMMKDFTAGHIQSELSRTVIDEISKSIDINNIELYPGVSYRNIMIWREYPYEKITSSTPPHDITGKNVSGHLPHGSGSEILRDIMNRSATIISSSASIKKALETYDGDPGSVWLWGGGRRPAIETLEKRFGLKGYTISAVDLIHGIGRAAGLQPLKVEGATGYIDTNYKAKADALLKNIEKSNFILLHVESPDESGHEGNLEHKLQSIKDFDEKVVGPVMKGLEKYDNYALMVLPDHPTPVSIKTHSSDPVPFIIYSSKGWNGSKGRGADCFSEKEGLKGGLFVEDGYRLIEAMLNNHL